MIQSTPVRFNGGSSTPTPFASNILAPAANSMTVVVHSRLEANGIAETTDHYYQLSLQQSLNLTPFIIQGIEDNTVLFAQSRAGYLWQVTQKAKLLMKTSQKTLIVKLGPIQVTQMHIDASGQHCLLLCPDQIIYNHFESHLFTSIDVQGFSRVSTTWITKSDNTSFEAIYTNSSGEIWHACYEGFKDGKMQAFKALDMVQTQIKDEEFLDIRIVRRKGKQRDMIVVFAVTETKLYQWRGYTTVQTIIQLKPFVVEFKRPSQIAHICISTDIEGEPYGFGLRFETEFAFCKLSDATIQKSSFIFVKHHGAIDCALWQFHICFMYDNFLEVVNLVSDATVFKKECRSITLHGIDYDRDQLIVHGGKSPILVATIERETNEIWRFFQKNKLLKEALKYCNDKNAKQFIATDYALELLEKQKFEKAADIFQHSSKPFEQVCLILGRHPVALIIYLEKVADALTDHIKKQCVLTVLLELKLTQMDKIPQQSTDEKIETRHNLISFINKNGKFLNEELLVQLLYDHSLLDLVQMFGNDQQKVEYYNQRSEFTSSFETILQVRNIEKRSQLLLSNAIRLVNVKGFFKALMEIPIPNPDELVSIITKCDDDGASLEFAEYLCTLHDSKLVYDCAFELNLKVNLAGLTNFLQFQEDRKLLGQRIQLDIQFVMVRLQQKLEDLISIDQNTDQVIECLIMANAIAGDFDKAVKLALEEDKIVLAQKYIRKAAALLSQKERKQLWLQVAEKLLAKDINSSLDYLMTKSPLLMQDLIPYLPKSMKLSDLKQYINLSVTQQVQSLQQLQLTLEVQATQMQKMESEKPFTAHINVNPTSTCYFCKDSIFTDHFFIFPCKHSFHRECSVSYLKKVKQTECIRQVISDSDFFERDLLVLKVCDVHESLQEYREENKRKRKAYERALQGNQTETIVPKMGKLDDVKSLLGYMIKDAMNVNLGETAADKHQRAIVQSLRDMQIQEEQEEQIVQASVDKCLVKECLLCSHFQIQLISEQEVTDSVWDF